MPANLFRPACIFQSTHPARGATEAVIKDRPHHPISIHAPREGCDRAACQVVAVPVRISIHAPREGCDEITMDGDVPYTYFNPRTPRGVRLEAVIKDRPHHPISIHAPREGCDGRFRTGALFPRYFNPRTPRGVRLDDFARACVLMEFQSTHPARGATANFTKEQGVCLAQFAYLHKGKKAEHTKTNAPMLH